MAILKDNLTKQVKNIGDFDDFKARIEKKYGSKIVDGSSERGYSHFILANGDKVQYDDDSKLIGNPFHHKKGGGSYSHMTKPHYSEDGYKPKGGKDFDVNWPMSFGAGTLAYAKSIGLTDTQIRKAQASGLANVDDVREELRKLVGLGGTDNDFLKTAKTMGLTNAQIEQAKAEGVTDVLGLRRIEKNSRGTPMAMPDDDVVAILPTVASEAGRELSQYGRQKTKYKVTSHKSNKSNKSKSRRNSTAGIGSAR